MNVMQRKSSCDAPAVHETNLEVSRLVILHEEAEDGNAMPDLTRPVNLVSKAVDNLIKVNLQLYSPYQL
ncbi:hypothetical protein NECAME_19078 [Necator americanus]|uniref:Uncharacterized protein n=1 Tax=Necator americanus TaxID=51031 RepID=W2STE4_NECAM|nr:hypothetical protein NECAME_19078 [Necator americanus]ETN71972.1 hypothetical protein NECAME_19078 [Necator americanus]